MRRIDIYDSSDFSKKYSFISDICVNSNVTSFKYAQKYNELLLNDYAFLQEDESFTPQELSFEVMVQHGEAIEFKNFVRLIGKTFVLKIWTDDEGEEEAKWVLAKRDEEELQQIGSTNWDKINFSFKTLTNFIKIKNSYFQLGDFDSLETGVYQNSDHTLTEDGYIYSPTDHSSKNGIIYGQTTNTIDNFIVNMPVNNGDRKMYLKFTIIDFEDNPQYGLGNHANSTDRAYLSKVLAISKSQYNVVNDSYTPLKKIILESKTGISDDINIEFERDFSKDSYLYLMPNEEIKLYMRNIYSMALTCYEQYTNL